jgi:hypothetical protein
MIATFAEIAPKLKKLLRMLSAEQPGEVVAQRMPSGACCEPSAPIGTTSRLNF